MVEVFEGEKGDGQAPLRGKWTDSGERVSPVFGRLSLAHVAWSFLSALFLFLRRYGFNRGGVSGGGNLTLSA